MELFSAGMAPFTIALMLLAAIALIELIGMAFGLGVSGLVDEALPDFDLNADVDADADLIEPGTSLDVDGPVDPGGPSAGPFYQLLAWLCVGKVPILILLASFLMGFGITGLILQNASLSLLGAMLPAWLIAIPSFLAALPVTRQLGLLLARVMPKERTDAVSRESFVGRAATIIRGTAKIDAPAEAKLKDAFGYTHYVLVVPAEADSVLVEGASVLLVEKSGAVFNAIANTHPALRNE